MIIMRAYTVMSDIYCELTCTGHGVDEQHDSHLIFRTHYPAEDYTAGAAMTRLATTLRLALTMASEGELDLTDDCTL